MCHCQQSFWGPLWPRLRTSPPTSSLTHSLGLLARPWTRLEHGDTSDTNSALLHWNTESLLFYSPRSVLILQDPRPYHFLYIFHFLLLGLTLLSISMTLNTIILKTHSPPWDGEVFEGMKHLSLFPRPNMVFDISWCSLSVWWMKEGTIHTLTCVN